MNESAEQRRNLISQTKNPPKVFRAEYNAVKNYIHNELGITKDDIFKIIKETVQDEIQKAYNSNYIQQQIERTVNAEIYGCFKPDYWSRDALRQRVSKVLTDNLTDIVANQLSINVDVIKKS